MPDFHDPSTREQMEREGWIVYFTDRDNQVSYAYHEGELVGMIKDWGATTLCVPGEPWQANVYSEFFDFGYPKNHSYHRSKYSAQSWLDHKIKEALRLKAANAILEGVEG